MAMGNKKLLDVEGIDQSGHFTCREHPAAFNARLRAFIEGLHGN